MIFFKNITYFWKSYGLNLEIKKAEKIVPIFSAFINYSVGMKLYFKQDSIKQQA